MVDFKIVYNKQKHDISFPYDDTVTALKEYLEKKTGKVFVDSAVWTYSWTSLFIVVLQKLKKKKW